ncbi:MAG: zinc transporter ZupT [bacterium]
MSNIQFGFLLSLLAGLATGIGSLISIFVKKNDFKSLAFGLGLSAGVMIYISLVELLPESEQLLGHTLLPVNAKMFSFLMFFVGIFIAGLIDYFVPDHIEPGWIKSKIKGKENKETEKPHYSKKNSGIYRVGFLTAITIAAHNFPEGLATFVTGVTDRTLGVSIACAIAIHNIPEGMAVSIPIYKATNSKRKAFFYSMLSGLTEPLGALFGFFFLSYFLNEMVFAVLYAVIAGIMVYISFDELLPASREYGKDGHITILGVVTGMFAIGMSLAIV